MTPAAIGLAILQYGPSILPLIQKVLAWQSARKVDVTEADIAELIEYGKKTSADYLAEVGYVPPPATPPQG